MRLFLILFLFCGPVFAGDFGIQMHIHSNHFADRIYEDWNEDTDGFALRYSFDKTYAVQAGHYRNEHSTKNYNMFTNYVRGDYTPLSLGPVHFGGYASVLSGYNDFTIVQNGDRGQITSEKDVGVNLAYGLLMRVDYSIFNVIFCVQPEINHAGPAKIATEAGISF